VQSPATHRKENAPAFYRRRRRRGNELGQVLLRKGAISPEQLREALRVQAEAGGHVGAILKRMGACDSKAIAQALIEQGRAVRGRGKERSIARRARDSTSVAWLDVRCRPGLVTLSFLVLDVLVLSAGALLVAYLGTPPVALAQRYELASIVLLGMLMHAVFGLYAVTPPSPPDEIRSTFVATSFAFLGGWIIAVLPKGIPFMQMSHAAWLAAWLVTIVLVPTSRGILRSRMASRPWWGHPIVVMGAGKVGRAVVTMLQARPQLGLKPVAILDDDPSRLGTVRATWGDTDIVIQPVSETDDEVGSPSERMALEQFSEVEGVPVVGGLELAPALAQRLRVRTAVLAMPEMDAATTLAVIERFAEGYTNVLVIPDLLNLTHFGASTRYLGGALGIEVQRQLLLRGPRAMKRLMDVVLTAVGLVLVLPILATLVLVIWLDSRGSPFYRQTRLGQDGVRFHAFKFRTMFQDAEQRLTRLLEEDPALRAEYEEFHKLTNDPRVTRVGRVLRKYSLDELPQLWNVLIGEMSLVGPRPYLEREVPGMALREAVILRVRPGITGIWQVTWRNGSTFDQRVQLDVEYVRNWSPWLDLYILARTLPVVLGGTGS
jgi:lipopolysaccharide/colanic/teichoic acid biosynthesis glycosyltransferase